MVKVDVKKIDMEGIDPNVSVYKIRSERSKRLSDASFTLCYTTYVDG